jgi:undecaprenyl-diphosphatase
VSSLIELDKAASRWINQLATQSAFLDTLVLGLIELQLLRTAVIVALLCWAYWQTRRRVFDQELGWPRFVLGMLGAIVVARVLQQGLPGRLRPLHEPTLGFVPPIGVTEDALLDWSSFPSDHAVVFAAMTVAIWHFNRPIGWLAAAWTGLVILLPRVYTGVHYFGDILVGAMVGAAIMLLVWRLPTPRWLHDWLVRFERQRPGAVAAALFLFLYLCATLFRDLRYLLDWLPDLLDLV